MPVLVRLSVSVLKECVVAIKILTLRSKPWGRDSEKKSYPTKSRRPAKMIGTHIIWIVMFVGL